MPVSMPISMPHIHAPYLCPYPRQVAEQIKVVFQESALDIFITDTTTGTVVINGPKDNGYELRPDGVAAQNGLRKGDGILLLKGQSVAGMAASEVQAIVSSAGRPLEIVFQRRAKVAAVYQMQGNRELGGVRRYWRLGAAWAYATPWGCSFRW